MLILKSFLFLLMTLFSLTASAQQASDSIVPGEHSVIRRKIYFTALGGPTVSTQKYSGASWSPAIYFSAGAGAYWALHPRVAIGMNLMFERKGYRQSDVFVDSNAFDTGRYIIHLKNDYLTLSPSVRYYFIKKRTEVFAEAGYYVGRKLNSSAAVNYKFDNGSRTNDNFDVTVYRPWDMGLVAGLGIVYPVSHKISFLLQPRCTYGLFSPFTATHASAPSYNFVSAGLLAGLSFYPFHWAICQGRIL